MIHYADVPFWIGRYMILLFSCFFPQIIDSKGFLLYIRQNATKGRFSFTTEKQDKFDLCFYSRSPMGTNQDIRIISTLISSRVIVWETKSHYKYWSPGSGKVPDQMVKLNVKSGVEAQDRKEVSFGIGLDLWQKWRCHNCSNFTVRLKTGRNWLRSKQRWRSLSSLHSPSQMARSSSWNRRKKWNPPTVNHPNS